MAPTGTVCSNMTFPIYNSATGYTCSTSFNCGQVQDPNGNPDAAVTDPDTATGWYAARDAAYPGTRPPSR